MGKKITVKDVAREAGVSVATVSYILNDRTDQKISEATKKKVLQIANLLNYKPSHAAKSLATGRNNIIGIAYKLINCTPSRNIEITALVAQLMERLQRMHYDVITLPVVSSSEEKIPANRNIDAIIAIDLPEDHFRTLSNEYLVPIISVDMQINDPLFYQIYTDYKARLSTLCEELGDDFLLIMDEFSNETMQEDIYSILPQERIIFSKNLTLDFLASLKGKKLVVLGEYLALSLRGFVPDSDLTYISCTPESPVFLSGIRHISTDLEKKANVTINILLNALDHNFVIVHQQPL